MKRAWESDGGFWALSEGSQRNENHFLGQGHFASQVKSSYYSLSVGRTLVRADPSHHRNQSLSSGTLWSDQPSVTPSQQA